MGPSADAEKRFPLQRIACAHGDVAWREAGAGPALVLLHGIGSGSGSWVGQLDELSDARRVIAWDAPGYGGSAPLATPTPFAADYAAVLGEWLGRLGVETPALVGHSLGALVAAAYGARSRVFALVLASPARGYGQADPEVRAAKYRERVELVGRLGVDGMAASRAAGLCAPEAGPEAIERVRRNMARATPGGYAQAAHMLAHDDLAAHLRKVDAPVAVLCGELDRITPPAACEQVAREANAPFTLLPGVAHACYVEDPARFDAALCACLARLG